jgi:hypothetical protein
VVAPKSEQSLQGIQGWLQRPGSLPGQSAFLEPKILQRETGFLTKKIPWQTSEPVIALTKEPQAGH